MRAIGLALSLLLTAAPFAYSQAPATPPRLFAGGALVYGAPQGEFASQIDQALGARGHLAYRFDDGGWFAVRLDGGALIYGQEEFRVPLSSTIGGRITVDVTTSNNIFFLGLGPQIGVPDGRFRPYANGFVGITFLNTTSSVSGTRNGEGDPFASTSNQDDATFAYGGGAGLFLPLRGGYSPISLDVGLAYHRSGEASYLREGDIEDRPDGTIVIHPVHSRTDLLNLHVGISVGLPDRGRR
jgi:hypothetical protein